MSLCHWQFINDYTMNKYIKCRDKSSLFRLIAIGKVLVDLLGLSVHLLTHADAENSYNTCVKQCSSKKALVFYNNLHDLHLLKSGEQNCPYNACFKVFTNPKSKQDHVAYCLRNLAYRGPL